MWCHAEYRRFGTTYRTHLQGSTFEDGSHRLSGNIGKETYHSALRKVTEERRFQHRSGNLERCVYCSYNDDVIMLVPWWWWYKPITCRKDTRTAKPCFIYRVYSLKRNPPVELNITICYTGRSFFSTGWSPWSGRHPWRITTADTDRTEVCSPAEFLSKNWNVKKKQDKNPELQIILRKIRTDIGPMMIMMIQTHHM